MTQGILNQTRSILLVDDSEEDYEAITRALKKAGVNNPVFWCKDGDEALDFLKGSNVVKDNPKAQSPGLILLDLNMPGMDGRQTLQIIKEDVDLKRIPVVILTTSSSEQDVQDCYQMGANGFIQKPANYQGMINVAENLKNYWFGTAVLPDGHA
jgi:two-component system response regulator